MRRVLIGLSRDGALRSAVAALLILLVVLSAVVGPGRVLCIGEDGHVGVEAVGSACCEGGAPASPPVGDAAGDADDCGPCTDVAVSGTLVAPSRGPSVPQRSADAAAPVLPWTAVLDAFSLPAAAGPAPRLREPDTPLGALRDLRSVRLLC